MARKKRKNKSVVKQRSAGFPFWIAAAVVVPVVFALVALILRPGIVDDAYIIFRYSANFAHGHGLVYNIGERVEGYSTFLWTFLLGFLAALKIDPVKSALFLGAMFGLTTPFMLVLKTPFGEKWKWWAPVVLVASPCYVFWCLSGMGSPLATLLLTASVLHFIRQLMIVEGDIKTSRTIRNPMITPGILLALAGMTRMESILTMVPSVISLYLKFRGDRRRMLRLIATYLISFGVPFSLWFLWRWHYYGWLLPNTYYDKVSGGGLFLFLRGLTYLGKAIIAMGGMPLIALASLIVGTDWRERYLGACANVVFLSVIRFGGDHFALYRFIVPSLPFLALLLPIWVERMAGGKRRPFVLSAYLILSFCLTLVLFHGYRDARTIVEGTEGWEKTGKWLAENVDPNDSIATQAIGAIGYHSDLYIIDVLGLVDEHIAHLPIPVGRGFPGHEKHDSDYVIGKSPKYLVLGHSGRVRYQRDEKEVLSLVFSGGDFLKGEQDILRDERFRERYEFKSYPIGDGTYIECYARQD